jgi:hypothetical protein
MFVVLLALIIARPVWTLIVVVFRVGSSRSRNIPITLIDPRRAF